MFTIELSSGKRICPKIFDFPGGEVGVRLPMEELEGQDVEKSILHVHITTARLMMTFYLLVDAMQRAGFKQIHLNLYYVPYARQDRVCVPGESLSIAVIANMVNCLEFESVVILDPHSSVTPALFNNVRVVNKTSIIEAMRLDIDWQNTVVVAPDAGAIKTAFDVAKHFQAADPWSPTRSVTWKVVTSCAPTSAAMPAASACWWSTTSSTAVVPSSSWPS